MSANDNTGAGEAARRIDIIAGTAITDALEVVSGLTDAELADLQTRSSVRGGILGLIVEAVDIEIVFRRDRPDLGPRATR